MYVLVPIDGSESSLRALRFGASLAYRFDADIDVVHFAAERTDDTDELFERAREIAREVGLAVDPELILDDVVEERAAAQKVGEQLIDLAEERGHDHVVMGRDSTGRLERFVLGSASETVIEESALPVTLIPATD